MDKRTAPSPLSGIKVLVVSSDDETVDGTQLKLSIEDDGVGFDPGAPRQGHYGIVGLHEQAHLIGAHLCIDSAPGRGTTLTVTLRMTPEML